MRQHINLLKAPRSPATKNPDYSTRFPNSAVIRTTFLCFLSSVHSREKHRVFSFSPAEADVLNRPLLASRHWVGPWFLVLPSSVGLAPGHRDTREGQGGTEDAVALRTATAAPAPACPALKSNKTPTSCSPGLAREGWERRCHALPLHSQLETLALPSQVQGRLSPSPGSCVEQRRCSQSHAWLQPCLALYSHRARVWAPSEPELPGPTPNSHRCSQAPPLIPAGILRPCP